MAIMTLPIAIPSTPSVENNSSPDSDTTKKVDNNNANSNSSSNNNNTAPPTPVSPTMPSSVTTANTNSSTNTQSQQPQSPAGQTKRKPSRRANTAERRATHNAVERQRRETLNGRFLDLAALLPNLSQIRRPSKSSIVNSSIAHVHASRRHRLLAARELRMLKIEADALRRELNEWRERAGIPRIDEPVRGEGFAMIISGELEVIVGVGNGGNAEDDEDDEGMDVSGSYGGYVGGDGVFRDEEFAIHGSEPVSPTSPVEDSAMMAAMIKNHGHPHPFAHGVQGGAGLPLQRPAPMGSGATNVPATFDPMYEGYPAHIPQPPQHHQQHHLGPQQQPQPQQQQHTAQLQHQQQMMQQQHAYMQQALRERERERESASMREREQRAAMYQRQQEQEKMWGLYNSAPPSANGKLAYPYPQQHQNQQQQSQMMMMQAAQRSLFTPPATSHGLPTPSSTAGGSSPIAGPGSPASISSASDEQHSHPHHHHHYVQHPHPHPHHQHRERSGSVHSSRGSHSPAFELGAPEYAAHASGEFGGVPRGMSLPSAGMDMMGMGVQMGISVGVEGM